MGIVPILCQSENAVWDISRFIHNGTCQTEQQTPQFTERKNVNMANNSRNRNGRRTTRRGGSIITTVIIVAICAVCALMNTNGIQSEQPHNVNNTNYSAIEQTQNSDNSTQNTASPDVSADSTESVTQNTASPDASVNASADGTASGTYQWTAWDAQAYPNCYRIVGKAVVDRDVEAGTIEYDGFDSLGRTQRAVGNITKQMVDESAGWRAEFKSDVDTITGWKGNNHKIRVTLPNGKGYSGYCYNRSHLVGDCLGGYEHVYNADGTIDESASKSEKQNLVTGTRMQNVGQDGKGGMSYCENLVMDYLKAHPNVTVYYSATPVYDGNDLVCRSVFVDIKSSDGGLDQEVEVFNAESGCTIDYTTGKLTAN